MLLRLQNQLKRDPEAYRTEFLQQQQHFQDSLTIFQLDPSRQDESRIKDFTGLVSFMAHAAPCYRDESAELPNQLLQLLSQHRGTLEPELRLSLAQALIQLQNREMLDRMEFLPLCFSLFELRDAKLRELLYTHIIGDIRRLNQKKKQIRINSALQNYMYKLMRSDTGMPARKSVQIMIDLYGRRIWNDAKTVNAICLGCFSEDTKILSASLRFLLGRNRQAEEEMERDTKSLELEHVKKEVQRVRAGLLRVQRKKRKQRELKRLEERMKRAQKLLQGDEAFDDEDSEEEGYIHPMELIYDPQAFAERLFTALRRSTQPFNIRLLMMNTISRLIGARLLLVFNFYPFLQKYLQPHQSNVTAILSYLAQAVHPLVPPETVYPILATLAQHFITDRSSTEATVVGLNAVREICARAPLAMTRDLLHNLAEYRKSKEKPIMMAARSIIALYREQNPELLEKKDRGKDASLRLQSNRKASELGLETQRTSTPGYGELELHRGVKGAELLELAEREALEEEEEEAEMMKMMMEEEEEGTDESEMEAEEEEKEETRRSPNKAVKRKTPEGGHDEEEGEEEKKAGAEDSADEGDDEGETSLEFLEMMDGEEEEDEEEEEEEAGDVVPTAAELGISATRIFTNEDFRRIAELERNKSVQIGRWGVIKKKREDGHTLLNKAKLDEDQVTEDDIKGFVDGRRAGFRPSKEDRLARIEEGREDREKFGVPKMRGGGTTNAEKNRHKPFILVNKSSRIRNKQTAKFSVQQKNQAQHIKNLKRLTKRRRTRRR